jgi:hypothetical protein
MEIDEKNATVDFWDPLDLKDRATWEVWWRYIIGVLQEDYENNLSDEEMEEAESRAFQELVVDSDYRRWPVIPGPCPLCGENCIEAVKVRSDW